jgi:hypothetical protein
VLGQNADAIVVEQTNRDMASLNTELNGTLVGNPFRFCSRSRGRNAGGPAVQICAL